MAVNLVEKTAEQLSDIKGVSLFTAQAGIKKENHNDVTLMILDEKSSVGAVFTQNKFCAAPVHIAKQHLAAHEIRALVINTGNANAGTGASGREHALAMCQAAAEQANCMPQQVLPFSTGVILEPLPIEKIQAALPRVQKADWAQAARAIMTTDTLSKAASSKVLLGNDEVRITGIAKGAGMICPNMATMLGFIASDAAISQNLLQQMTAEIADESFNCITVDGDTSTNDSFIIIATGQSGATPITDANDERYAILRDALLEVALELAQAIVRDGEGASKFITVRIEGAKNKEQARRAAYAIAHSPLVKTAFFASDPNLGRLLAALGYSGAEFDFNEVKLFLDDVLVAENGGRAASYTEEAGQSVMNQQEITVRANLNQGEATATVYTCDLSHDYVSINADYRS